MGKSTPEQPDPIATAKAQGDANMLAASQSARLNRYNTAGPGYHTSWINNGEDGVPTEQVIDLDPAERGVYDQAVANSGQAGGLAGRALAQMDPSQVGITGLPQLFAANFVNDGEGGGSGGEGHSEGGSGSSALDQAQEATYRRYARTLDPEQALQSERRTVDLDSRGIPVGSDAWVKANNQLDLSQNSARQDARDASVASGNALQAQLFGQSLAARNQMDSERSSQIQRLASLMSLGQGGIPSVGAPQSAGMGISPVDIAGINQGSYNASAAKAQSNNQATNVAAGATTAALIAGISAY